MKNSSTSLYGPLAKRAYKIFCENCVDKALLKAAASVWKDLVVFDSGKLKRAAGYAGAYYKLSAKGKKIGVRNPYIKLSKELMKRMTPQEQLETVSHELAHIIDFGYRMKSDHGPVWKRIHAMMGGSGAQFHRIETRDLRKKKTRFLVMRWDIYANVPDATPMALTKASFMKLWRGGRVLERNEGFYRLLGVVTVDGYNKREEMSVEEMKKRGLFDIVSKVMG